MATSFMRASLLLAAFCGQATAQPVILAAQMPEPPPRLHYDDLGMVLALKAKANPPKSPKPKPPPPPDNPCEIALCVPGISSFRYQDLVQDPKIRPDDAVPRVAPIDIGRRR